MRTTRPCGWCGRATTTAGSDVCPNCVTIDRHATDVPPWTDGLYGGNWVNDGGIQRWVPWETETPETPPVLDLIACPTCRATVTETCRTKLGHRTSDHSTRLLSRRCECGREAPRGCRWCGRCRAERDRAKKRVKRETEVAA